MTTEEMYCNDKGFIMVGQSLKYLFCHLKQCSDYMVHKGYWADNREWDLCNGRNVAVERIPIPQLTAAEQEPFVKLVDQILKAKDADPDADTSHLEWEIDRLVYDLYGLTEEEDTAIERSLGLIDASDEEEDAAFLKALIEADNGDLVSEETVKATLLALDGN